MSYTGAGYVGAVGVASYLKSTKHGGLVQPGSIAGSSGGWNVQNPSAQQISIASNLNKVLIPTGYSQLKKTGSLEQATINVLSKLGISPDTQTGDVDPIISEYNDLHNEQARLGILVDELKRLGSGRTPDLGSRAGAIKYQKELDEVNAKINAMTITDSIKRNIIQQKWSDFMFPPAFAEVTPTAPGQFNPPGWDKPYDYGTEQHQQEEPHLFPQIDPSTSSGLTYNTFEPPITVTPTKPIPEQIKCPARVQIVSNITNVVAGEGEFNCATIERYEADPDYRIVYTQNGFIPTQEPEPTPEPTTVHVSPPEETRCYMVHGQELELTEQAVGYYINLGVTVTPCGAITDEVPPPSILPTEEPPITTDHITPPEMPVEEPMVTSTEPGQVNWIPEPFFSFINNVLRR